MSSSSSQPPDDFNATHAPGMPFWILVTAGSGRVHAAMLHKRTNDSAEAFEYGTRSATISEGETRLGKSVHPESSSWYKRQRSATSGQAEDQWKLSSGETMLNSRQCGITPRGKLRARPCSGPSASRYEPHPASTKQPSTPVSFTGHVRRPQVPRTSAAMHSMQISERLHDQEGGVSRR